MKTKKPMRFDVSGDGELHIDLEFMPPRSSRKRKKFVLFKLEDDSNHDQFWMTMDENKLKDLADFIYQYLELR
jgi:hypothetical protein